MNRNEFLTDPRPIGEQIADRAKSLGVSVSEICRRAGVMPYQVTQWKKHDPAGISGLRRIEAALQDMETATTAK